MARGLVAILGRVAILLSSFHALPPSLVGVGAAAIDIVSLFPRRFSSKSTRKLTREGLSRELEQTLSTCYEALRSVTRAFDVLHRRLYHLYTSVPVLPANLKRFQVCAEVVARNQRHERIHTLWNGDSQCLAAIPY